MPEALFDEAFLKKLEYLYIVSKKVFAGRLRAERRSKRIGSGIEFADHRDYTPGDDLRYMDWNLYGRLDKLLLRLFEEEEDLTVYFLLDGSASMAFGETPKFTYAKKVAAALSYIALSNLDRVSICRVGESLGDRLAPARSKANIFKVFEFLADAQPGGRTDLAQSLEAFVFRNKRRGLAVLISDLYDPAGFAAGLNYLRYHRFQPFVVHLIDDREARPTVKGDLSLVDCETGEVRQVTLSARALANFARAHADHCREMEELCRDRHAPYFRTSVQVPFEDLILKIFRSGGFLK